MSTQSFVVSPSWLVPVVPEGLVLHQHSLVAEGERIIDILPTAEAREQYSGLTEHILNEHILIPGLINAHGHAAMTLLRGYADDKELMDWLNNYIWPAEAKYVDESFVYDGTLLAAAEMIQLGTTFAVDTYFFPPSSSRAYMEAGLRAQVCAPVIQFPNAWAQSEDEHIHKALEFHNDVKTQPLIQTAFAPHAPYTVTDAGFEKIGTYASELDIPIHLHLHETRDEVDTAVAESGKRPIQRIKDLGLLNANLQAVHMTQLLDKEIQELAAAGVQIAHCPDSNLKLASGICPVTALEAAGVNIAVGTDGVASNNNLDMLAEIRSAALLAKGTSLSATAIPAERALSMGTIHGARMVGREDDLGSLEVGKLADMVAVDLSSLAFQPIHNPLSQLIYSATGHQVAEVWINGEHLLHQAQHLKIDTDRVIARAKYWREKMHL